MSRRSLLSSLLLLALCAACGAEAKPAESDPWQVVLERLPGALLSVWGSSASDVWAVGGDAGDGLGPMVLHYDGATWQRLDSGVEGDLWWVFGFAHGPVFMGGSNGTVLRVEDDKFERLPTPGSNTVYGLWGSAPDDVWAVGGAGTTPSGGFAWHYDGASFREAAGLPEDIASSANIFKVWGRSAKDVVMVGSDGLLLRYDGKTFARVATETDRTLFTVHGDAERIIAVGGFVDGAIVEADGARFVDVTPERAPQLAGVFQGDEAAFAVGIGGAVYSSESGAWARVSTGLTLREDLHSVWQDERGGVWAVGGQVLSSPLVSGVLIYRGAEVPPGSYSDP